MRAGESDRLRVLVQTTDPDEKRTRSLPLRGQCTTSRRTITTSSVLAHYYLVSALPPVETRLETTPCYCTAQTGSGRGKQRAHLLAPGLYAPQFGSFLYG
jgi:hypothetical protein